MSDDGGIAVALGRARSLAASGADDAAKGRYMEILQRDPTHFDALNELAALAYLGGYRSAARSAYEQAVRCHPDNAVGRINLATMLLEAGDAAGAITHLQAVLARDPDLPEAHQGLARAFTDLNDPAAEQHWQKGFDGHAIVTKPYRGTGTAIPLLLLVAARGGNIPTQHWLDDRSFAISVIYCDYADPAIPLPPHALVLNAIGDADLCGRALATAETLLQQSSAPVINPPARVRQTGRIDIAQRLKGLPGVIAPAIHATTGATLLADGNLRFPVLLRKPGFHTGQHFHYVEDHAALTQALDLLPGDDLLAIAYLDARGSDGMARKYRVMFIDGIAYPLHLAISADWKVHYFSADMAENAAHRAEEQRFLEDMPRVLGPRAMAALAAINASLGLDYAGIDFGLSPDGEVLLFECNATMVVYPPEPDPRWDYRRAAIDKVLAAAKRLLAQRAPAGTRVG